MPCASAACCACSWTVARSSSVRMGSTSKTTRRIVPKLEAEKIPTEVHEFDAGHIVPADIAADAIRWFTTQ